MYIDIQAVDIPSANVDGSADGFALIDAQYWFGTKRLLGTRSLFPQFSYIYTLSSYIGGVIEGAKSKWLTKLPTTMNVSL